MSETKIMNVSRQFVPHLASELAKMKGHLLVTLLDCGWYTAKVDWKIFQKIVKWVVS